MYILNLKRWQKLSEEEWYSRQKEIINSYLSRMFFPMKYGTRTVTIGIHDPVFFQCPNCKRINTVSYVITSTYYHFWYIPIFPFEKDGYACCSDCRFKIESLKYSRHTKEEFKDLRKKYRHPFYTYIFAALFISPFAIGIISNLIKTYFNDK